MSCVREIREEEGVYRIMEPERNGIQCRRYELQVCSAPATTVFFYVIGLSIAT